MDYLWESPSVGDPVGKDRLDNHWLTIDISFLSPCPWGFSSGVRPRLLTLVLSASLSANSVNTLTCCFWLPSLFSSSSHPRHHFHKEAFSGPSDQPVHTSLAEDSSSFVILMQSVTFSLLGWPVERFIYECSSAFPLFFISTRYQALYSCPMDTFSGGEVEAE